jgi:MGT family glycosyltransferase
MGRFLFIASPLVGHVLPTIAVGRELVDRGHEVAWAGHTEGVADRLPPWAGFIPVAGAVPAEVEEAVRRSTARSTVGLAAFMGVWRDYMAPVARQMLPGVHAAIDRFAPDVVVVDQQAVAGAVACEARGLRWATSATTSAELISWIGEQLRDQVSAQLDAVTMAYLDKLVDWHRGLLRGLLVDLGLDGDRAATFEPRFSPWLVIAYTTPELLGFEADFPGHFALVGPSIGERPGEIPFPWAWLDGRPLVLVSLGTINWRGGARFFEVAAEALSDLDAQAVFIAPGGLDVEVPPNVLVRERVPQLDLLARVDAVVSHGGHNTVCETLSVGRPLVIAPIRDDQPIIGDQVTRAGAGVTVRYRRVTASQLHEALTAVLTDTRFREAAERLRASFAAAGGPARAARRLVSVAERNGTGAAGRSATGP